MERPLYDRPHPDQDWIDFESRARSDGLRGALRFLNDRTPHRFTGIYRLDPPTLRNVHLFDQLNPELIVGADSPLAETYCSIVAAQGSSFATGDALEDPRLRDHAAARGSVRAYMGAPLVVHGQPFGTLCHFDLVPRPVSEAEMELLRRAPGVVNRILEEGG